MVGFPTTLAAFSRSLFLKSDQSYVKCNFLKDVSLENLRSTILSLRIEESWLLTTSFDLIRSYNVCCVDPVIAY